MQVPPNFIEFYETRSKFERWVQRLQGAFQIYGIKDQKSKNSYFLHYIGAQTYDTICDLVSPAKPEDRSYEDNVKSLTLHLDPQPLEIAEYHKFHNRQQKEGESVKEYIAELRKMAATCNFGSFLHTALRNQFVCGIRNPSIKNRLLEQRDLTLEKAYDIAVGMESVRTREEKIAPVNSLTQNTKKKPVVHKSEVDSAKNKKVVCYRCGGNHYANKCKLSKVTCNFCKTKGHLKKMCLKLKKSKDSVNAVDHDNSSEIEYINNTLCTKSSRFWVYPIVNNKKIKMEFDSGSAVSIISSKLYNEYFQDLPLLKTKIRLCTYSNNFLNVLGYITCSAAIGTETQQNLKLYVVSGKKAPLLGREWIKLFTWERFREYLDVRAVRLAGNVSTPLHTTNSSESSLKSLFKKYSTLFDGKNVGEIKGDPVALHLRQDAKPIFCRARSVPFALKEKVDQEIDNLVKAGVFVKVDYSEYATPVVPVVKANGKVRLCGDYKITLNPQLIVDEHPLPTSEELFHGLAGGEKFSKIDLCNAYLNWRVREQDQHLLTLNTHKGLYKCTRLMFGLNCAPAKWQRKIENILKDIPGVHVFIDDIRITGPNDKIHLERLETVFSRLAEYGLKVNLQKSEFLKDKIEYCGYIISKEGISGTNDKIKAIKDAPRPKNLTELQSFLGLINYYGRFFHNLSNTLEPLHRLLRKDTKWRWSSDCEAVFQKLKKHLISDTVLAHYAPDLPLVLATDASPTGVGAILSHIMPDGSERPIHYASQTLNCSQRKWAQIDKEAYAIIFGVKKFFQYLYGRKFILYTDHKPLLQIFSPSKALPQLSAVRMQHYAVYLQGFNYEIRYKTSKANANADALSRLPLELEEPKLREEVDVCQIELIEKLPINIDQICNSTKQDLSLQPLLTGLRSGRIITNQDRFGIDQTEFSLQNGCIMRGSRVVIPTNLRSTILKDLHTAHFGINRMLALARHYCWWPGIDRDVRDLVANCVQCCLQQRNPISVSNKHCWEYPTKPFERVHIDFAGKFMGTYFLILVDAFSKWPEVYMLDRITTENTIDTLEKIFATFGYPTILTSDNGPQFTNYKFQDFLRKHSILHRRSAPYNPATNGQVERYVQTIKNKLKCCNASKGNVQQVLNKILFMYRITPHPSTSKAPSELVFTYQPNSNFSSLVPDNTSFSEGISGVRTLSVGERVIARNYMGSEKWKFGIIQKQLGKLHYLIKMDNGLVWKRHIDQVKRVGDRIELQNEEEFVPIAADTVTSPDLLPQPSTSVSSDDNVLISTSNSDNNNTPNVTPDLSTENSPSATVTDGVPSKEVVPSTNPSAVAIRKSSRVIKPVQRLNL